jgi:hypothetical protein
MSTHTRAIAGNAIYAMLAVVTLAVAWMVTTGPSVAATLLLSFAASIAVGTAAAVYVDAKESAASD